MYAYCHAQTVDRYDFTYPMKEWMRPFEEGIGKILTGVFVGCPTIEELLLTSGIFQPGQVWALGHPFDSAEVRERMPKEKLPRENKVVFSSRWDWEKQPQFFLQVAEQLLETVPHAKFVVCTSHPKLKSNKPELLELLHKYRKKYPENFYLKEGLTKEEYYRELCTAKAQFNSSLQDFISYVLLEASVAGCYPVYPSFRSFPETLLYHMEYMYPPWEVAGAVTLLQYALLAPEACSATNINERAWIHRRFDKSCERILSQMGIINKQIDNPFDFNADKEN
jgi:glycosyltransferase involved in cell wall biosynthesis